MVEAEAVEHMAVEVCLELRLVQDVRAALTRVFSLATRREAALQVGSQ
jgi:hypothetical protein